MPDKKIDVHELQMEPGLPFGDTELGRFLKMQLGLDKPRKKKFPQIDVDRVLTCTKVSPPKREMTEEDITESFKALGLDKPVEDQPPILVVDHDTVHADFVKCNSTFQVGDVLVWPHPGDDVRAKIIEVRENTYLVEHTNANTPSGRPLRFQIAFDEINALLHKRNGRLVSGPSFAKEGHTARQCNCSDGECKQMCHLPDFSVADRMKAPLTHAEASMIEKIQASCEKLGLPNPPPAVEFTSRDKIGEVASYSGFPVRYPHWKWGEEYEEMARNNESKTYVIDKTLVPGKGYMILIHDFDEFAHRMGDTGKAAEMAERLASGVPMLDVGTYFRVDEPQPEGGVKRRLGCVQEIKDGKYRLEFHDKRGTPHVLSCETFDRLFADQWKGKPLPVRKGFPEVRLAFSRRGVIKRDNKHCRFCGDPVQECGSRIRSIKEAVVVHLVPRSKGGQTNFENCVTACYNCCLKKGEKTFEEAGMNLLPLPDVEPLTGDVSGGGLFSWVAKDEAVKTDEDVLREATVNYSPTLEQKGLNARYIQNKMAELQAQNVQYMFPELYPDASEKALLTMPPSQWHKFRFALGDVVKWFSNDLGCNIHSKIIKVEGDRYKMVQVHPEQKPGQQGPLVTLVWHGDLKDMILSKQATLKGGPTWDKFEQESRLMKVADDATELTGDIHVLRLGVYGKDSDPRVFVDPNEPVEECDKPIVVNQVKIE